MREYLVRLIYCEMLGHDASAGYVEAIKFAQQTNSLDKRVGKCLTNTTCGCKTPRLINLKN